VKQLIVTADDVGLHRGMTLGAIRAHRQGIVTACSVVGCGAELDHAVDRLRDCPALDVGAHLMLVEGRPVSPPSSVPTLVTPDGGFVQNHRLFVACYARGRVSLSDVEAELRAQLERVLASGLSPCHLNGHQHVHVLPRVFEIVLRLAAEYRIPYVRIPDDRVPAGVPIGRRAAVALLRWLARRARRLARAAGLYVNDATIGIAQAGHLDASRLGRLLPGVAGVTELVTHPGVDGAEIGRSWDWGYEWDAETGALCDPAIATALSDRGIELVGVRAVAW